jgi:hypothetical protein
MAVLDGDGDGLAAGHLCGLIAISHLMGSFQGQIGGLGRSQPIVALRQNIRAQQP